MKTTTIAAIETLAALNETELDTVVGGADPNDPNGLAEFLERYFRESQRQQDMGSYPFPIF